MTGELIIAAWIAAAALVMVAVAYSRSLLQAKRLLAFIVSGDVIIPKKAKLTEEGVEVDGKVYPAPRDAFKIVKWRGKHVLGIFLDASTNAAYVWKQGETVKEAPPELLSKLALKRILRQLTRREVQILPFITGLLVGLLVLTAGAIMVYQQVVVPAESKAAAAQQVLSEYNALKSKYDSLLRENERLQQQLASLQEQLQALEQQLAQCNATVVNATTGVGNGG